MVGYGKPLPCVLELLWFFTTRDSCRAYLFNVLENILKKGQLYENSNSHNCFGEYLNFTHLTQ